MKSLIISLLFAFVPLPLQAQVPVGERALQAGYEDRLRFINQVDDVLGDLNELIRDFENNADETYASSYLDLKQQSDVIQFQLNNVDNISEQRWPAAQHEIVERLHNLTNDIQAVKNQAELREDRGQWNPAL